MAAWMDVFGSSARGCREVWSGRGWSAVREAIGLAPGDVAVFPAAPTTTGSGRTFLARFYDADGNERLSRVPEPDDPSCDDEFLSPRLLVKRCLRLRIYSACVLRVHSRICFLFIERKGARFQISLAQYTTTDDYTRITKMMD